MRLEAPGELIERIRDNDLCSGAIAGAKFVVNNEHDLAQVLGQWMEDFSLLRHPDEVPDLSLILFRLGPINGQGVDRRAG